jgi:hypothetical protein
MLRFQNIIKRFCHHHSRDIFNIPKVSNPLVECENKHKCIKPDTKKNSKTIPVEIQYYKNKKLCTIIFEVPN